MEENKRPAPIRGKGWFLTYPQCPLSKEDVLEQLQETGHIIEYVICQEDHKEEGKHIHAFVKYEKRQQWSAIKWDIGEYHGNYQIAKSWIKVKKYVLKDGNYIANINLDSAMKKQNKHLLEITPKQAVDEGIIPLIQLPHLIKAKAAYNLQGKPIRQLRTRGTWIHGPPGTGKTHAVHELEDVFTKSQNKWWDGYEGQKNVLLDDFDHQGACLGHYLKIWTDKWECTGEIKGGTIPLNYKKLFITSNYEIKDIWPQDAELQKALLRRFKVKYLGEEDD